MSERARWAWNATYAMRRHIRKEEFLNENCKVGRQGKVRRGIWGGTEESLFIGRDEGTVRSGRKEIRSEIGSVSPRPTSLILVQFIFWLLAWRGVLCGGSNFFLLVFVFLISFLWLGWLGLTD